MNEAKSAQTTVAEGVNRYIRPQIENMPSQLIRAIARVGMEMEDAIPLWFGEPDLPTPDFICEAAARAAKQGLTFYTPNRGVMALREAIATYSSELYARPIDADRITITASGVNAIMLSMQLLLDAGDNMVAVGPLWPNIVGAISVIGAEARMVPLDFTGDAWLLDLERLTDAVDERTRGLIVNTPNNPTGWMMQSEQRAQLLALCRARGLWIVADEVYARITYDRPVAPSFLEQAEPDDRVIVINSFSKPWAMTGWRVAWLTTPPRLGPTLEMMNEYNVAGANTLAQHAAITALKEGEKFVAESVERYRRGRDIVYQRLSANRRTRMALPEAAFYAFFAIDGMTDSLAFAMEMLEKTGVGMAPGVAFGPGGEGFLRLCFASKPETLITAMDRFEAFLDR